ncbi:MAG TPA: GNAT family N-acetyltransferase [Pseudonocardia sp.]|nr:GNAT family N-acetyltransferase [Pseudonocardia sp.]
MGAWLGWAVRPAVAADAAAIGTLHVRAWRHSYRGIVPDEILAGLDPVHSAGRWSGHLSTGRLGVFVASSVVDVGVGVAPGAGPDWPGELPLGAFCAVGPVREEPRAGRPGVRTGELYALYADPLALGRGAGPAVHDAGVAHLGALGYRQAVLWVLAANPRARAFYARRGWRLDGLPEQVHHDGVPLPAVRYWCVPPPAAD